MSEQQRPQFSIEKIYVKDLSLEIPNAPQIFLQLDNPQIDISVHNGAGALEQAGLYQAVLTVTVTAKLKDKATDTLIEQTETRPLTTFAAITAKSTAEYTSSILVPRTT